VSSPKQLYLLRHAKSSWDDQLLADHDRPLSPRGQKAVKLLAEHFRTVGIEPEHILCSSSRRTCETLEGVLGDVPALVEPALYGASCRELIARLHRVPPDVSSVLLVGHNPAMQMLVLKLASAGGRGRPVAEPDSPLQQIERKFPTGALATLEFDGEWSELAAGRSRLLGYVRPKALA
jgi:phosphohistidine phosphatase